MKIKKFQSSNGLEILVGRDDRSNDALTFSIGRAHDVWLHVSGASGSHVILRNENADAPDKESLKEAAALAAWFSKMRAGGNVTVSYCLLKDVSKPRGLPAGKVTIKRAKKMTVRPALLEELAGD
ncbi:MAG: NFACT RNA binding domain-containing protein [bacterium]